MNVTHDEKSHMVRFYFDGVDDLMKTATSFRSPDAPRCVKSAASIHSECFTVPDSWNGQHTIADVERELLKPTPKMASVIDSGESMFSSEDWATDKPKRKIRRRLEDGDEIDIDRWREREPDMWEESKKVRGPRFGVKIGVNIATSAHIGAEGFKWRTSTVVAILRICEELNIPCEVMGYEQTSGGIAGPDGYERYNSKLVVHLKRPEHLLDVDLLGYCLGSRSFFRNAVLGARTLAIAQYEDGKGWDMGCGMGSPNDWSDPEPNEFVVDRGCLNKSNAESEVKRFKDWLVEIKRKAGINFDGLDRDPEVWHDVA